MTEEKEIKERARGAKGKKAALGEDVNIESYTTEVEEHQATFDHHKP